MASVVTPSSALAGIPLRLIPVVVNIPAIPTEEIPVLVHAMEAVRIAKAENSINKKKDCMIETLETWIIQMTMVNECR